VKGSKQGKQHGKLRNVPHTRRMSESSGGSVSAADVVTDELVNRGLGTGPMIAFASDGSGDDVAEARSGRAYSLSL
jgi:hypothetical protein